MEKHENLPANVQLRFNYESECFIIEIVGGVQFEGSITGNDDNDQTILLLNEWAFEPTLPQLPFPAHHRITAIVGGECFKDFGRFIELFLLIDLHSISITNSIIITQCYQM